MMNRISLALAFTAGLAVCSSVTVLLDRRCLDRTGPVAVNSNPTPGAIPRTREQAAVLNWIFEHRAEASELEFLRWSPSKEVTDNPFSHGPATLVKLVVKNRDASEDRVEQLSFYLCDFEVLGGVSEPYPKVKAAVCV